MSELILIVTRNGAGEWSDVWGFANACRIERIKKGGERLDPGRNSDVVLLIIDGQQTADCFQNEYKDDILQLVQNYSSVLCTVHGRTNLLQGLYNGNYASYTLEGNYNPPAGSLGRVVKDLADSIRTNNGNFDENLEKLKNKLSEDNLKKSAEMLVTALAPLFLHKDEKIKQVTIDRLKNAGSEVHADWQAILGKEANGFSAWANRIADKEFESLVEEMMANESMMRYLSGRYL